MNTVISFPLATRLPKGSTPASSGWPLITQAIRADGELDHGGPLEGSVVEVTRAHALPGKATRLLLAGRPIPCRKVPRQVGRDLLGQSLRRPASDEQEPDSTGTGGSRELPPGH